MIDFGYKVARANGGSRFHLLPYMAGYTTALCGKRDPKHNRNPLSSHANRARWVFSSDASRIPERALCDKCRSKALEVVEIEKAERAVLVEGSQR